jgi:hypothetical protein
MPRPRRDLRREKNALELRPVSRPASFVGNAGSVPIGSGDVWRARSSYSYLTEILIVDATDNRRHWLVESLSDGKRVIMSGDNIRASYRRYDPAP